MTTNLGVPSVQQARIAVMIAFFINSALFANWASHIPTIQALLSLEEGELGIALLGMSIGVITALTITGGLIARYGSRTVTVVGALGVCLLIPFLALMPTQLSLMACLFCFGMTTSIMDVAMNTQAVAVERRMERPSMSSFHAIFSIGGVAGAFIGAGMVAIHLSPLIHFTIVAVIGIALALVSYRHLLTLPEEAQNSSHVFQLPHRSLLGLGVIAFCAAIGEGAMADWSGVYLSTVVLATPTIATLGYAAFATTMTIGRLLGDRLAARYSPALLVRGGGLVAGLGLLLAIIVPQVITTLIGFGAVGIGLAVVVPLAFSTAGRVRDLPPGTGIAGVATIGYAGFLAGPPIIGVVAEATSLQVGLGIVALLVSSLLMTGRALASFR